MVNELRRRAERAISELGAPTFPKPGEVSRVSLVLIYAVRVVVQVIRQTARDRLPRQAASLSFQTLLSAVPLTVIAFSILTRFISLQEVGALADWLSQHTLPSRAQAIAPVLQSFAASVDVRALGVAGGLGLFATGVVLFINVSNVVNDIWRVRKKRRLPGRIIAGFLVLVLGPVLVGLSIYFAQRFVMLPRSADFFAPLLFTATGLWVAYRAMPQTKVRSLAAAGAALAVGVLLEAGKTGFGFYVARIEMTMSGLYGAIGFVPLALLWLYVSWLLFLFGVELSYTLQNLRSLWLRDADLHRAPLGATAGGPLALRIVFESYRAGSISAADLALRLEVAPQAVDLTVDRLVEGGVVSLGKDRTVEPTRRAALLPVAEVLGLFSETRPERLSRTGDRLGELLDRLDESRDQVAGDLTVADLL